MTKDHANVAVFPPLPFALAVVVGVLAHALWEPLRFFPEHWIGHAAGWPLVLLPAALMVVHYGVISLEERYLERIFGDVYRQYLAKVRRWL